MHISNRFINIPCTYPKAHQMKYEKELTCVLSQGSEQAVTGECTVW